MEVRNSKRFIIVIPSTEIRSKSEIVADVLVTPCRAKHLGEMEHARDGACKTWRGRDTVTAHRYKCDFV